MSEDTRLSEVELSEDEREKRILDQYKERERLMSNADEEYKKDLRARAANRGLPGAVEVAAIGRSGQNVVLKDEVPPITPQRADAQKRIDASVAAGPKVSGFTPSGPRALARQQAEKNQRNGG